MKKILAVSGCIFLALLLMPAFIQRPARDEAQEEAVVLEGARLLQAFAAYQQAFEEYPSGGAAAIIRQLRGENERQEVFFECPPDSLNDKGELLDPWGNPYRITLEPGTREPMIQSAGRNRFFENADASQGDDYRSWQRRE